jgi:hypothetical protein
MKLTLFGVLAIIGVATLVVFVGISQWDSQVKEN